eukprot:1597099-Alexandrium_andersonii.AAC.1
MAAATEAKTRNPARELSQPLASSSKAKARGGRAEARGKLELRVALSQNGYGGLVWSGLGNNETKATMESARPGRAAYSGCKQRAR